MENLNKLTPAMRKNLKALPAKLKSEDLAVVREALGEMSSLMVQVGLLESKPSEAFKAAEESLPMIEALLVELNKEEEAAKTGQESNQVH